MADPLPTFSTHRPIVNPSLTENLIGPVLCAHALSIQDRCIGSLISCFIGDALGAATEGDYAQQVREKYPTGVLRYVPAAPMGLREVRQGMYTDDTNTVLALADSLVEKEGLDPEHIAKNYAIFFLDHKIVRGCPPSATQILKALKSGIDYRSTGTMVFPDGSWANGSAMRIAPIGLAFRNATDAQLREATRLAVISTHVHPNAVDGAFVVAKAISVLIRTTYSQVNADTFLDTLIGVCHTTEMRERLTMVKDNWHKFTGEDNSAEEDQFLKKLADPFQIECVGAVAVVVHFFLRHGLANHPAQAISRIMLLGGDTDTIACILGGMIGALYGTHWVPAHWWSGLENGEYGKDYCVLLGKGLALLDLTKPLYGEGEMHWAKGQRGPAPPKLQE